MRGCVGLLAAACSSSCLFGGAETGPCAHDSLACGDGPLFVIDEACESTDALLATLGEGEREFVALLPGAEPARLRSQQGTEYLAFALRIDDPDPDHLVFRVEIDLEIVDDEGLWADAAERRAVYAGDVVRYDGEVAEIVAIVVLPERWYDADERRINVDIRDSCNRAADIVHAIAPEPADTETDTEADTDTDGSGTAGTSTGFASFE